jgi:hypothetical protein
MIRSHAPARLAFVLSLIAAPFANAQQTPALPQTPEAWRAAAESDLESLRGLLRDHTPVAVDDQNPHVRRWFERGYREARARVRRVRDQPSHFFALSAYMNGFQDPHLSLFFATPLRVNRWPGFIVTARGEDAIVFYRDDADASAPALGARIVSCDGQSIARLRERIVFPFAFNPRLANGRRMSVPRLFLDQDNVFGPAPRRCVVEQAGVRRTLTLKWRDVPEGDGFWTQYNAAGLGAGAQFGLTTPAEGIVWIGAPSFANGASEQLRALIRELEANAETIRSSNAVVIDIRGNDGGNSSWGDRLAVAVWGRDVAVRAARSKPAGTAADWRVSPGNRDFVAAQASQMIAQFGESSSSVRHLREVQDGLGQALARGDVLWRQGGATAGGPAPEGGGYTQRRPHGPSPIRARVYVLSNGACVSACLDFADIALHIPGTQLIGADTSGDGLLMDLRGERLPSGLAIAALPMKVYRGRGRGALEAYAADVAYDGVWTDEAVRAWVMDIIARSPASPAP